MGTLLRTTCCHATMWWPCPRDCATSGLQSRSRKRGWRESEEVVTQLEFYVGGVGGNHFLGMRPTPVSFAPWRDIDLPAISAKGVSMEMADECCSGLQHLPQRAKPPSAGGGMDSSSSRNLLMASTGPMIPLTALRQSQAHVARVM